MFLNDFLKPTGEDMQEAKINPRPQSGNIKLMLEHIITASIFFGLGLILKVSTLGLISLYIIQVIQYITLYNFV